MSTLAFGLEVSTQESVLVRLDELRTAMLAKSDAVESEIRELRTLTQREFINVFRREQASVDAECPNVFTLVPEEKRWGLGLGQERVALQLFCQAPNEWHPTQDGGRYVLANPARWLVTVAPYLSKLIKVLRFVTPILGPWVAMADEEYFSDVEHQIELTERLVERLPGIVAERKSTLSDQKEAVKRVKKAIRSQEALERSRPSSTAIRAVRYLLEKEDPRRQWGGLRKLLTPEGHIYWLCEHHFRELSESIR